MTTFPSTNHSRKRDNVWRIYKLNLKQNHKMNSDSFQFNYHPNQDLDRNKAISYSIGLQTVEIGYKQA